MKKIIIRSLIILVVMTAIIASCKKDKSNVPSLTGNYVIKSAQLIEALVVPTNEAGNVPVPSGTDITTLIQTALLSAVSCTSAADTYVELRKDFSMYLSCKGSNPFNAGTWEEVSSSELTLNLNSTAIPSSPTGFVLAVTGIVTNQNNLTGITSVPLPKAMIAAMIAPLQITLSSSAPDVFLVKFSVVFTKQ